MAALRHIDCMVAVHFRFLLVYYSRCHHRPTGNSSTPDTANDVTSGAGKPNGFVLRSSRGSERDCALGEEAELSTVVARRIGAEG